MIKILKELWDTNSKGLYNEIKKLTANQIEVLMYLDLVKMTFKHIYPEIDTEKITEIDHGNYQGTLLYVMPFKAYQPNANEYLLTCVSYGSCSFCDTLQNVNFAIKEKPKVRIYLHFVGIWLLKRLNLITTVGGTMKILIS